ncbi:hypothetical protein NDU88_002980 [Pleurodeles waltl]|uniref:Uncharacterized protein n=1 Tax=Pleurodeles waltl TaxID=8319 RepID=A0AAV7T3N8_PLEWA|nr:hypothetical protein NDU88_002980 [Pleurodeles waltl]
MRLDIVGLRSHVTGRDQRVASMEDYMNTTQDRDQNLLYLRSKLVALEDRSRRNNIRFFGFLEQIEGTDIQAFLQNFLPTLTNLTFDPPLKFQRADRLGLKRQDGAPRPCSIIVCLLRHGQAGQLLLAAQAHGPFWAEGYEIRITADFSKETNDRRKAFLSLIPLQRQLDVKYGLFDPSRMWITKNGASKDFYEQEDLILYLDILPPQLMDTTTPAQNKELPTDIQNAPPPPTPLEGKNTTKQNIITEAEAQRDSQGHMMTGVK